ncbi:MAG TPA: hypothetical protein VGM03_04070 [Phycisphaerae bacterium]
MQDVIKGDVFGDHFLLSVLGKTKLLGSGLSSNDLENVSPAHA